jgi:hypothetical protein
MVALLSRAEDGVAVSGGNYGAAYRNRTDT